MTKNRVLDELRALERRPRSVVDIEDVPPLEVLDQPFERLEAIDAVWRAVANLNVDLKMALLLRDIVGLSYTEIADSLEVTLAGGVTRASLPSPARSSSPCSTAAFV